MTQGLSRRYLEALRQAAARALADDGAVDLDDIERARRARDYRTWTLMEEYPSRVSTLARTVLGPDADDDATLHHTCVALTDMLAALYRNGRPDRHAGQ